PRIALAVHAPAPAASLAAAVPPCHAADALPERQAAFDHGAVAPPVSGHDVRHLQAGGEHECGQCQVCHSPAAMSSWPVATLPHAAPEKPAPRLRLAWGRRDGDSLFRPPRS
ncbi:MAG TPA: hypothetical protein VNO84_10445, partial [Burkholderiaceae bacterium]|nr:hypothetical protein [Burkholderiaceae bacterium]